MAFQYWQDYFEQLDDHPYSTTFGFQRAMR